MLDLHKKYPPASDFFDKNGKKRFAYLTFVMLNESFIPGALVLAYALRLQKTLADLVCLVTKDVSPQTRSALLTLFDKVVEIDELFIPHNRRQERQDRPFLFTRFQALRSGTDGDLGLNYEKITLVDADILPLQCFDHLFSLDTPAGILNESKANCIESDSSGRYILPTTVDVEGTWHWHRLYDGICPHGVKIPHEITDRVFLNPTNMGVNSSLWVLKPSMVEYETILEEVQKPQIKSMISHKFNWPEMQFATWHWSGSWTNIDLRFSSFNGYPKLDVLCGTHFAGYKPWKFKDRGTILHFSRFPDYYLWQRQFLELMASNPDLIRLPRLRKLKGEINAMLDKPV